MHQNIPECTRIHQDATEYTRMHEDTAGYTKMQQDAPECIRMHDDAAGGIFPGFSRVRSEGALGAHFGPPGRAF